MAESLTEPRRCQFCGLYKAVCRTLGCPDREMVEEGRAPYDHTRCGVDGWGCAAPVADYDPTCNTSKKRGSTPGDAP